MSEPKPTEGQSSTAETVAQSAAAASKAKQSAAKAKKAAQRSQPKASSGRPTRVMVYMRGASHGAVDGQKRYFDPETAERLVRLGHARFPEKRG